MFCIFILLLPLQTYGSIECIYVSTHHGSASFALPTVTTVGKARNYGRTVSSFSTMVRIANATLLFFPFSLCELEF